MNQLEHIVSDYIQSLVANHQYGAGVDTRELTTRGDYEAMIAPVVQLLEDYPGQSAVFYREQLKRQSQLESNIIQMVHHQRQVSGAIVAYGTSEFVEIISNGLTEEGKEKEIDDSSIFDLSSISKLFTAVVTLCLCRDGYLELDKNISEYDKRFLQLRDITIRQLLSFQRIIKTPVRLTADMSIEDADQVMYAAYEDTETDTINSYSDIPFMVLRYILEATVQTSAFALVNHYILTPLRMTDTVVTIPYEWLSRTVSSDGEYYVFNDGDPVIHATPLGMVNDDKARIYAAYGQFAGHAGLFSTVRDMHKFIQAFFSEQLLPWELLNEIGINRTGERLEDCRYRQYLGYGCYSKNPDAVASEVYHPLSGNAIAMSGFTGNHISIDIGNRVFVIIATNRCHNRVSKIVNSTTAQAAIYMEGEQSKLRYKSCQGIYTSHRYAYQKDELVRDPALRLALQNRLIDLVQ